MITPYGSSILWKDKKTAFLKNYDNSFMSNWAHSIFCLKGFTKIQQNLFLLKNITYKKENFLSHAYRTIDGLDFLLNILHYYYFFLLFYIFGSNFGLFTQTT